jgi:hypothetical protein
MSTKKKKRVHYLREEVDAILKKGFVAKEESGQMVKRFVVSGGFW